LWVVFWRGLHVVWQDPRRNANSLLGYCLVSIPAVLVSGLAAGNTLDTTTPVWIAVGTFLLRRPAQQDLQPEEPLGVESPSTEAAAQ